MRSIPATGCSCRYRYWVRRSAAWLRTPSKKLRCYDIGDGGGAGAGVGAQDCSKPVDGKIVGIGGFNGLRELLTDFFAGFGNRDVLDLASFGEELRDARIGLTACARLLYRNDFSILE